MIISVDSEDQSKQEKYDEIIAFIEEEFWIAVGEDQMTKDNLGSVIKIVNFIEREMAQQTTALSEAV